MAWVHAGDSTDVRQSLVEEQIAKPALITIVNTNSPLRLDGPMIEGLFEMATHLSLIHI